MSDSAYVATYFPSGAIRQEEWRQAGVLHREKDLPAKIIYHDDGSVCMQDWYQQGKLHREGGLPAEVFYLNSGAIIENWCIHGIYQRTLVTHPEPRLEDLVKPAFATTANIRKLAFAATANIRKSAILQYETAGTNLETTSFDVEE